MRIETISSKTGKYTPSRFIKGALLLTTVLALPTGKAFAQTLETLSPTGGWSVTRMQDDKQENYCTLSRSYENGKVLSLARNKTEEYSLAIDFQRTEFDPEEAYALTLQPGLGQLRAYEVLPTSPQAFVVRLGWDENFLDALTESGVLKVQVAQDKYEFGITDLASGLNDLESCMEGLPAQAEIKPTIDDAATLIAAEEQTLKEPAPKAEVAKPNLLAAEPGRTDSLFKAKKVTAAPAIPAPEVAEKKEIAQADAPKEPVEIKVAKAPKMEQEPPALAEKIAPETEPKATPAKTASVPARSSVAADVKDIKPLTAHLNERNATTNTTPNAAPSAPDSASLLRAEEKAAVPEPLIAEAPKKVKAEPVVQTISTKDFTGEKELAALKEEVARLKARNDQLRGELAKVAANQDQNLDATLQKKLAQIIELESKLEAAKADNVELSKQLDSMQIKHENTLMNTSSGDWSLESATKRYNEAEREIQRLALELESEKTSCRAKTEKIENMLFDPAVAEKQQISRLMELERELEAAKAKLAQAQSGVMSIPPINTAEVDRLKAVNEKLQQEIASYQNRLQVVQQQLSAASSGEAVDSKAQAEKIATLQTQVQLLSRQLAESEQELKTAKAAPAPVAPVPSISPQQLAEAQQKIAQLQDQNTVLQDDVNKLRLQITQQSSTDSSRADRLAALKLENEKLRNEVSMKSKESVTFQNQIASLQQDLGQIKSRLSQAESRSAESRQVSAPVARTSASAAAVAPVQRVEATYAPAAPAAPAPATIPQGFSKQNLEQILSRSGISASSVRQSGGGYAWSNGSLNGQAVVAKGVSLDRFIQSYIAQQEAACAGDFASMPSSDNGGRSGYEIACVTQTQSQAASVLFFEDQGSAVALSYQADAANMDMAIDARDRLAAQIVTGRRW